MFEEPHNAAETGAHQKGKISSNHGSRGEHKLAAQTLCLAIFDAVMVDMIIASRLRRGRTFAPRFQTRSTSKSGHERRNSLQIVR